MPNVSTGVHIRRVPKIRTNDVVRSISYVQTGKKDVKDVDDPFWSESNQRHLAAAIERLENHQGQEHELIDA